MARNQRLQEARELYIKACSAAPLDCDAWLELADVSRRLGNPQEAERASRHVLSQDPRNPVALHALATALHQQHRLDEAITCYRQLLRLQPDKVETRYFNANALSEAGHLDEAEAHYEKVIELQPDHRFALNNLSVLLKRKKLFQQAAELLRRALQTNPDVPRLLINYGYMSFHAGDAVTAADAYRRAIVLAPEMASTHSNLLACMNYLPDVDPATVYAEHRHWNDRHAAHIQPYSHWQNEPDPNRRLRIGYSSPDLREHPVASFLEPVLETHASDLFEVICYADVHQPDAATEQLRGQADCWRDTHKLSHEQLAAMVYSDRVDILFDLSGHTAYNRMPAFARKPAPLQISWLGYPNTTGLDTMDFRLADALTDPSGMTESLHSETLVRLPDSFLCYRCPDTAPDVAPLPAGSDAPLTFGSFNNLAKTTPAVIRTWARILQSVPGSRLLLKSRATGDRDVRARLLKLFGAAGADPARVQFHPPVPDFPGHMAAYQQIDIGLDTFPYNGTTTTCEALWMGVPVISLAGRVHAARVGASLLTQVGLESMVVDDEEAYIDTAVHLSQARDDLAGLRAGLRKTVRNSPLCDAGRFTLALEQILRTLWTDWCRKQTD